MRDYRRCGSCRLRQSDANVDADRFLSCATFWHETCDLFQVAFTDSRSVDNFDKATPTLFLQELHGFQPYPAYPNMKFSALRVPCDLACRWLHFASTTTFVVCAGLWSQKWHEMTVSNGPVKCSLRVVYVGCQTHRNIDSPQPSWVNRLVWSMILQKEQYVSHGVVFFQPSRRLPKQIQPMHDVMAGTYPWHEKYLICSKDDK